MYRKITWPLTCLILALPLILLSACNQEVDYQEMEEIATTPIVARAAGMTFREADIDHEIRSMPESLQHLASDPLARARILNVLLRRAILSQQAQQLGLDHDPVILSQINRAKNTILIEALENWQASQVAAPSEQQIGAYYKQHLADFTIPEQIHARHILLGSEKEAWEILKKLERNRDSFDVLAATHSLDDSNKSRGGDLNWFPRNVMVAAFEKAAFSIKEGGLSSPVKTQFGWHVIEVLGKRPAHTKPLDESRDEIANLLQQQVLDQWLARLMSEAEVTVLKPEYQTPENMISPPSAQEAP